VNALSCVQNLEGEDSLVGIAEAMTFRDLENAAGRALAVLGGLQFAYRLELSHDVCPIILSNYDDEWVRRYVDRNYFKRDPVVRAMRDRLLPLWWADLDWSITENVKFFREAEEFGIGPHGVTLKVRGPTREWGLFSATFPYLYPTLLERSASVKELLWLVHVIHDHTLKLANATAHRRDPLSLREKQCLQGLAQGLSAKQVAFELHLSMTAIRLLIRAAQEKLGVHTIHGAVAEAMRLDLVY
jgi:DNA-binding CsgD family transcriptional regulator